MNVFLTFAFSREGCHWRYGLLAMALAWLCFLIPSTLHAQDSNMENEFDDLVGELVENESAYGGSWTQREPEFGFYIQFVSPDGEEILQAYADRYSVVDQIYVSQSQYSFKGLEAIQEVLWDFCETHLDLSHTTGIGVHEQNMTIFVSSENPDETERVITGNSDLLAAMAAVVDEAEPERILNVIHFEYGEQPVDLDTTYRVLLPIAAVR